MSLRRVGETVGFKAKAQNSSCVDMSSDLQVLKTFSGDEHGTLRVRPLDFGILGGFGATGSAVEDQDI